MNAVVVVGTRPNFVKAAPLMRHIISGGGEPTLIHTGQHWDNNMFEFMFRDLGVSSPDVLLGVGGGSRIQQLSRVLFSLELKLKEIDPDVVFVFGDVTSTLGAAICANHMGIPLVHVEAGLRSGDRSMPEENNRIMVDIISDLLFCSESSGMENLASDPNVAGSSFLVGNIMIDSLMRGVSELPAQSTIRESYILMTIHRPENVDTKEDCVRTLRSIKLLSDILPIVIPVHPRTKRNLKEFGLFHMLYHMNGVRLMEPMPYLKFLKLQRDATVIVTDSGGIQEEATFLGVPCVTMRTSTERPITVRCGTNILAGIEPASVRDAVLAQLKHPKSTEFMPPLWDGHTASRILKIVKNHLG